MLESYFLAAGRHERRDDLRDLGAEKELTSLALL